MSKKFQNKYRSESFRLKNWDYSANGLYFITICSAKFKHIFGKIIDGNMILSEIGIIAQEEWDKSFEIRTELFCHAFIIMPNHLHAQLEIKNASAAVPTHGRASMQHGIAYRPPNPYPPLWPDLNPQPPPASTNCEKHPICPYGIQNSTTISSETTLNTSALKTISKTTQKNGTMINLMGIIPKNNA